MSKKMTNKEAAALVEGSLREAHLTALELISTFAFGEADDIENALFFQHKNAEVVLGSLLSHCRYIFEYVAEITGRTAQDVSQGYSYYFYSNILPDLEQVFDYMKQQDD